MRPYPPLRPKAPVRVVLATTTLLRLISPGRGAALTFVELGGAAFFASGVGERALGASAPWFILAAVLIGVALRRVDLEACALFIPGGLYGTVKEAFGKPTAKVAASTLLVEYLLLGALAASVAGHYVGALGTALLPLSRIKDTLPTEDVATLLAVGLLGLVWWRQRQGQSVPTDTVAWGVTLIVALLGVAVVWGTIDALAHGRWAALAPPLPRPYDAAGALALLVGLGSCLFAVGGSEALTHVAPELQPPKIINLRRTARRVALFSVLLTAGIGFVAAALVPEAVRALWYDAPLVPLPPYLAGPVWIRSLLAIAGVVASVLLLGATVTRSALSSQTLLARLSNEGLLAGALRTQHARLGTPSRLIDMVAVAQISIVIMSAGQVSWLARMYAIGLVGAALLKIGALIEFRARKPGPRPFKVGFNFLTSRREWPLGLVLVAALLLIPATLVLVTGDPAAIAGAILVAILTAFLAVSERAAEAQGAGRPLDDFQLMPATDLGLDHVDVRPGNLLVAVRRPHMLAHLAQALQAAGDRDVVAMTVRLTSAGAPDDQPAPQATEDERRLFTAVVDMAERYGRAVRLLVVPASNVFDAVVDAVLRLHSSEVYTGESETLSADDQARLLGTAWERVPKSELLDVRLIIHHSSGRTATYHLGAHAPTLTPDDLNRIHALWLDVVKAVGPHVHHRDVVRASLIHMEQELRGPNRDAALDLVRQVARPAEELAAVVHQRDFGRLRDMVRNRDASELARVLTDLTHRGSGRRVPRAASQSGGVHLRVPLAGRSGSTAQGDGPGGRGGPSQQHGAGRPHDVPRRAARQRHAAAPDAPDAGGAVSRAHAARISRGIDRPADDAPLHRRSRALDGAGGARLRPHARTGQRDAQRHLRRRRSRRCSSTTSEFASCC